MKRGLVLTILIAILAFGAFLRLNQINDESLWLDEGVTYYNSSGESYAEIWDKTARLDQSPPFYYFLIHEYLEIFGENEFGFRLIPLTFGVLTILFLYLLISAMFNMQAGLFAAFLLAINPFHIGFSIESRMYGLLCLESLMAFYFLYKAMTHETRGYEWWAGFIIVSILGLYTHNFYMFVLLALGFVFLPLWISAKKKMGKLLMGIFSIVVVGIAYLPWIPSLLKQLQVERYWMAPNSISNVKDYFLDFTDHNQIILISSIILILLGFLWVFSRVRSLEFKKGIYATISLVLFLIIGLLAPLAYSIFYEPILKIRYVVYLVPILIGLISIGLYTTRRLNMFFPIFFLAASVYLFMPWQASAYPVEFGEDFRKLSNIAAENPSPVVVHTPSAAHVINFYNQDRFEVHPFPYSDDLTEYNIDKTYKSKFIDLIKDFDSYYLVVTHTHENPPGLLFLWSDSFCKDYYRIEIHGMQTFYFSECMKE